ncbi:MAG: YdcF family protein [Chloroflexi bacterium]|nr:YdcF family protein [Chloroflexota bacterium]
MAEVARKLPNMSFVFVGPEQTDVAKLAACSNVHLLGARRHNEVPNYIKAFDLGLIPYVLAEYTDTVYPAKMAEYLAMGIPVVASDLPSIRDFNAEFGEVIQIANGAEEFAAEIESAVTRHSPEDIQRRLEVARLNSWESFIADASERMREAIEVRKATEARWEESLRRIYRRARRRILRTALSIFIVLALLFYSPFLWMLAEPLRLSDPPQTADAIVVFAGGVGESGRPGAGYQERVRYAIDLYKTGKAPVMVFVSGSAPAFEETEVMKLLALAYGVPESAIVLEKESASTYEYVTNVNRILRQRGWRSILLVTSPYHMRRAMWTWQKAAPEVAVTAAPIPYSQFYDHGIGASSEQIGGIAHEYLSLVVYWWQGKV